MKTSQKGIDLIKAFEGLSLKSYLCPANVWTIGFGHTENVVQGQRITEQIAEELLKADLSDTEQGVSRLVKRKLSQYQFDALVSFCYNCGLGNFLKSTLLKKIRINPNDTTITAEFNKWIHAGGKPLEGLRKRRAAEAELYFTKEEKESEE